MEKLLFFLGKWKGQGQVIEKPVKYLEEAVFTLFKTEPVTVVTYSHMTWKNDETKMPMHCENGILKIFPQKEGEEGRRVEANFSHPFSLNEFEYGLLKDDKLILEANDAKLFQRGNSAKGRQTTHVKREYFINENGQLQYKMYLGVDGGEPYYHLDSSLSKVE